MSLWPVGDLSGSRRAAGLRDPRLAGLPLAPAGFSEGCQHRHVHLPGGPGEGRGGAALVQARACRLGHHGPSLFPAGLGRPVTVAGAVAVARCRLELDGEFAESAKGARGRSFGGG